MKKIKKRYIVLVVVVLMFIGGYFVFGREQLPEFDSVKVERGDVTQLVSVTGTVKAIDDIDLGFEVGGKVDRIDAQVGQEVEEGDVLLSLESDDLVAALEQALAGVEAAQANIAVQEASRDAQQAQLNELLRGSRTEEKNIAQAELDKAIQDLIDAEEDLVEAEALAQTRLSNAEKSLADAQSSLDATSQKADIDLVNIYDSLQDTVDDAFTKADDAVNQKTDELFLNDDTINPQISFDTIDEPAEIAAENLRINVKVDVDRLQDLSVNFPSDALAQEAALTDALVYLKEISLFLDHMSDALAGATILVEQTTLNTYQTNVNTARSNVNTAISNINTKKQSLASQKALNKSNTTSAQNLLNDAQSNLQLTKDTNQQNISSAKALVNSAQKALQITQQQYDITNTGATNETIDAQRALVRQANASVTAQRAALIQSLAAVKTAQANLDKASIKSPINGIVTDINVEKGEIVSIGNAQVVSVMSKDSFNIETNIPEVDIAKVQVGNTAELTLDAFDRTDIFLATVRTIDPAETLIEGVPTYKVVLQFEQDYESIKSGMTADIDILTAQAQNVLFVPQRSIISRNGSRYVRLLNQKPEPGNIYTEIPVQVGITGGGSAEILSGVREGESVITFIEE